MKLEPRCIEAFLARPDPERPVVLLYGPDRGLVGERLARLVSASVPDPANPFAVTRLDAAAIEREPVRLAEEAQSLPMFGDSKVVVVRDADDRLARALSIVLALPDLASRVLLEAGDLPPSSKLRQLVERAKNAVAIPCYREEGATLRRSVAELLQEAGLEAAPDVVELLTSHLGADRTLTRSEIAKLALYIGDRPDRRVQPEDVAAVVVDAAPLAVEAAIDAMLAGRPVEVARLLDRLFAEGESAVGILRRVALALRRLLELFAALETERDPRRVVEAARPPIFFRRRPVFEAALCRWRPQQVTAALAALEEAELLCKTTGVPDQLVCRQKLLELASAVS